MPARGVRYIHAFLLAVQHFRDEAALSRATPGVAAPRLSSGIYAPAVGTIPRLSRRENRSNVRPSPSRERTGRDMERERKRERERRGTSSCRMVGEPSQMMTTTTYLPPFSPPSHPCVPRYVSRLPSASMVLSTLQKSLSTCCLSVSPALYIRECRAWISAVATSFYAFNIIKRGITGKSRKRG